MGRKEFNQKLLNSNWCKKEKADATFVAEDWGSAGKNRSINQSGQLLS